MTIVHKIKCKFCGDIIELHWGDSLPDTVLFHLVRKHFEDVES